MMVGWVFIFLGNQFQSLYIKKLFLGFSNARLLNNADWPLVQGCPDELLFFKIADINIIWYA